jgi:spore germination protein KA
MDATFELLREAGLRLPRAVGPAISIVGALVIGDAAVRSGLVSTPMVVIIAFTGIASYTIPSYNAAVFVRIIRFPFLLAGGFLGYLGLALVMVVVLIHLCSLESLGVPFMEPFAPLRSKQISDTLVRRPWLKDPGKGRQANRSQAPTLTKGGDSE